MFPSVTELLRESLSSPIPKSISFVAVELFNFTLSFPFPVEILPTVASSMTTESSSTPVSISSTFAPSDTNIF